MPLLRSEQLTVQSATRARQQQCHVRRTTTWNILSCTMSQPMLPASAIRAYRGCRLSNFKRPSKFRDLTVCCGACAILGAGVAVQALKDVVARFNTPASLLHVHCLFVHCLPGTQACFMFVVCSHILHPVMELAAASSFAVLPSTHVCLPGLHTVYAESMLLCNKQPPCRALVCAHKLVKFARHRCKHNSTGCRQCSCMHSACCRRHVDVGLGHC